MTIQELSRQYHIGIDKLQYFCDNHFIKEEQKYSDESIKRLSLMCTLYDTGMRAKTIKRFLSLANDENYSEQAKLLSMHRYNLLDDIHEKQKALDQLDYMVHEIKNRRRNIQ